jgi:pimeloyl-ACP methyl ester carboxylesterase
VRFSVRCMNLPTIAAVKRYAVLVAFFGLLAGRLGAEEAIPGLDGILRPWQTNFAALSPDGRYLAYPELDEDGSDNLVLVSVDDPNQKVVLDLKGFRGDRASIHVISLLWAGAGKLVVATDAACVLAVDASGQNLRKLVDSNDIATASWHFNPKQGPPQVAHGFDVIDTAADIAASSKGVFNQMGAMNDSTPNAALRPPPTRIDDTNVKFVPRAATRHGQVVPRFPLLITTDAVDTGSVVVEALGVFFQDSPYDVPTAWFRVALADGKIEPLGSGSIDGDLMFDRQGRPRILQAGTAGSTQTFQYAPAPGQWDKWQEMDQQFGADLAFDLTAQNYAGARSFPVGFGADPNLVYYASTIGRDTLGLYGLNVMTRARTGLLAGSPAFDLGEPEPLATADSLIFDRHGRLVGVQFTGLNPTTQWLDPQLAQIQSGLEAKFRHRFVQVMDWDEARNRILALISSDQDPGRYVVYDRAKDLAVEFTRRAPWLEADDVNTASSLSVAIPEGPTLTGYLTLPNQPRLKLAPLIVICHDGPWQRALPGYDREAQALASAGFAVWEVNYRGSRGFGSAFRMALRSGIDRIPLNDILASVDQIAAQYPVNPQRMGLFGRGFGGYLALRGLQLYPDRFRSAVSIDAPVDLVWWRDGPAAQAERKIWAHHVDRDNSVDFSGVNDSLMGDHAQSLDAGAARAVHQALGTRSLQPQPRADLAAAGWRAFLAGDKQALAAISPLSHPELITQPLLLIQDPRDTEVTLEPGRKLRDALNGQHARLKYQEIAGAYIGRSPNSTAQVLALAADFFNLSLYNFDVKVGTAKPTDSQP